MVDRRSSRGLFPSIFNDSFFPVLLRNYSLMDENLGHNLVEETQATNISLWEDESHVYVEAALPGVNEGDVEVILDKGVLWIRGDSKRHEEKEEKTLKYYYKASGKFSYHIAVPGDLDGTQEPNAEFNNGILKVTFNKMKKETPKKITIKNS